MQNQGSVSQSAKDLHFSQSFIQDIWNQLFTPQIQDQILNTSFNLGLKRGNLNPVIFAKFMVQQVAYENQSMLLWERALQDGKNDREFMEACLKFKNIEGEFAQWLKKNLFLAEASPIKETRTYLEHKIATYERQTYHYIFVVNFVCYKLYVEIYSKMSQQISKENLYFQWICSCSSPQLKQTVRQLEDIINSFQKIFDKQRVKSDLSKTLEMEINFFRAHTAETHQLTQN